MTAEKHVKLFELLHARTKEGNLNWADTVDKGTYIVSFTSFSVEISREQNENHFESDIVLNIRNSDGDFVERVRDSELADYLEASGIDRAKFFSRAEALYQMARREALGADKALDSILTDLKNIDPF